MLCGWILRNVLSRRPPNAKIGGKICSKAQLACTVQGFVASPPVAQDWAWPKWKVVISTVCLWLPLLPIIGPCGFYLHDVCIITGLDLTLNWRNARLNVTGWNQSQNYKLHHNLQILSHGTWWEWWWTKVMLFPSHQNFSPQISSCWTSLLCIENAPWIILLWTL